MRCAASFAVALYHRHDPRSPARCWGWVTSPCAACPVFAQLNWSYHSTILSQIMMFFFQQNAAAAWQDPQVSIYLLLSREIPTLYIERPAEHKGELSSSLLKLEFPADFCINLIGVLGFKFLCQLFFAYNATPLVLGISWETRLYILRSRGFKPGIQTGIINHQQASV